MALAASPLLLMVVFLRSTRSWFPVEYKRGHQIMTRTIPHHVFSGPAFQPAFA
jgi:hypothetical protein